MWVFILRVGSDGPFFSDRARMTFPCGLWRLPLFVKEGVSATEQDDIGVFHSERSPSVSSLSDELGLRRREFLVLHTHLGNRHFTYNGTVTGLLGIYKQTLGLIACTLLATDHSPIGWVLQPKNSS